MNQKLVLDAKLFSDYKIDKQNAGHNLGIWRQS